MKRTSLENPEVIVKDKRIRRLDRIVQEVKESDEWEAVQMNILEIGIEKGRAEGEKKGRAEGENSLATLYTTLKRLGRAEDAEKVMSDPDARQKLYRELGIGEEN
jgi:flagellar biosynthesis/type III secretory pathway protein FliH